MKILLVEDETLLSNVVSKGLRKLGYAVDTAFDGEEACFYYETNEYDLIILDLNLPVIDGIDVLSRIRENDNKTKVIILSARISVEERVLGLDSGANDYLVKPFDFMELSARVRSLLRRDFVLKENVLKCGEICLDMAKKTVEISGNQIKLTKKEYSILEYLMLNKNRILSAEKIIEHVWESDADLFSNAFKFHIYSLKKKLNEASASSDLIKNIRGQGYIIKDPEDKSV